MDVPEGQQEAADRPPPRPCHWEAPFLLDPLSGCVVTVHTRTSFLVIRHGNSPFGGWIKLAWWFSNSRCFSLGRLNLSAPPRSGLATLAGLANAITRHLQTKPDKPLCSLPHSLSLCHSHRPDTSDSLVSFSWNV